jgi:benzoyl-CoA reductase subunit D
MMTSTDTQLTVGLDVGSAAVKVAVMRSKAGNEGELIGSALHRIRRRELTDVVNAAFQEALTAAKVKQSELDYVATTGEAESVDFRTGHFYSITTHARGGVFLMPHAGGVLDVGSLHARAVKVDGRGKVLAHRMTSQCASGTGQFLENIARYLGVTVEDVGTLSLTSTKPEMVSGICAVLAETDVINMVSRGVATSDILKGIHVSIATRLVQLARAIGVEGVVAVTGGLSRDTGLIAALGEQMEAGGKKRSALKQVKASFETHPMAMHAGAVGAALLGAQRFVQLRETGRLEAIRVKAEGMEAHA